MARKPATKRQRDPLSAAREVARALVAQQWPELAEIEPTVAPRARRAPTADDLRRMGTPAGAFTSASASTATAEYTFTFAGQIRTPEGYTMPRVARVTVDSNRRVVKATTSK
ncbi:MAG TPA: hypothetical protein VFX76_18245 [Roseiflexaceae bacterium]|nr:hypothetical protein [Roseiflexaceae bacterium]